MKTGLEKSNVKIFAILPTCLEWAQTVFLGFLEISWIFRFFFLLHFLELNPKLSFQLPSIKWPAFTLPLLPNIFFC